MPIRNSRSCARSGFRIVRDKQTVVDTKIDVDHGRERD